MLGVAAQRLFNGLAVALMAAEPAATTKLKQAMGQAWYFAGRPIPRSSRKALEPLRPHLRNGLADALTLDAVAGLLPVTRNQAGDSSAALIDEDTAHPHLQSQHLQITTELRAYFEQRVS